MNIIKKQYEKFKKETSSYNVFIANELGANIFTSIMMICLSVIGIIVGILSVLNMGAEAKAELLLCVGLNILFLIIPASVCLIRKGKGRGWKYILTLSTLVMSVGIYSLSLYQGILFFIATLFLSIRYWDKKLSLIVSLGTFLGIFIGALLSLAIGPVDLNYVSFASQSNMELLTSYSLSDVDNKSEYIRYLLLMCALPNAVFILGLGLLMTALTTRGKEMVISEAKHVREEAAVESEMKLAEKIQRNALPKSFPVYPNKLTFDAYALMKCAKEVGGDFYDIFLVDDNHLGLVIGDVAGKGVPASLFMMSTRSYIKNNLQLGLPLDEAMNQTNRALCEGNEPSLFVTVWAGVISLSDGKMVYVNAGHNNPLVKFSSDRYSYLESKHGLMLGALSSTRYTLNSLTLEKGDQILLYTDGITEACGENNEFYGEERLLDFVNSRNKDDIYQLVKNTSKEVLAYQGNEKQSDDITLLGFCFSSHPYHVYSSFKADKEGLTEAGRFTENELKKINASRETISSFSLVLDEIYSNIITHGKKDKDVDVIIKTVYEKENNKFTLYIIDNGEKFSPYEKEEDVVLPPEADKEGGLGLLMVKKIMDEVNYYEYEEYNVLALSKKL